MKGTSLILAALCLTSLALAGCQQASQGEKLWSRYCSECHGVNGAGTLPAYQRYDFIDLTDDRWSDEADPGNLEGIIMEGVFPVMPAFDHLSDQEIQAILDHLRVLRGEAY